MELRILGPLEVLRDDGELIELTSPKRQALLALLALNANAVFSVDRIVDELWGDSPPGDGARNVRVHISRLRDLLDPDRARGESGEVIATKPSGYVLQIDPEAVDAHRFSRLIDEARSALVARPAQAGALAREALQLWRDHPLTGLEFEEFAQGAIRRLEELHLVAEEVILEAAIRSGDAVGAIPDLERLAAGHPLREHVVALLMEGMAESGRRGDALRAYRDLEVRLAQELGLEPSKELRALEERILLLDTAPPSAARTDHPVHGGLPSRVTSFVGRASDLHSLAGHLDKFRLITLTGPGGVGKTSLAIEAARALESTRTMWHVDLVPIIDGAAVVPAIADLVGAEDDRSAPLTARIAAVLALRPTLLILDNCEHVIQVVAKTVDDLLQAVPGLTILCTSRRSLGAAGEVVYEVVPLDLPEVGVPSDETLSAPSVELFLDRAAAAAPGFVPNEETTADVVAICRRLDGIPLALELAASHVRAMTTGEIVESLEDPLTLAGRQRTRSPLRTLRDTMQWSYDLLDPDCRAVFDRLSVFASSFSRAAALAVGSPFGARDDALAELVDTSMLLADVSGRATRHRMLPTLRDFGRFNLQESGEIEQVRKEHAQYLVAEVAEMDLPFVLIGSNPRIEQDVSIDDFRAAAGWALDNGLEQLAVNLLVPLGQNWVHHPHEVARWMARIDRSDPPRDMMRWRLDMSGAIAEWVSGRNHEALAALPGLIESAHALGEPHAAAEAVSISGRIHWRQGDLQVARDELVRATEGMPVVASRAHSAREGLAVLELRLGNTEEGARRVAELAAIAEEVPTPVTRASAANAQGWLEAFTGDLDAAAESFALCRDLAIGSDEWSHEVNARLGLAWVQPGIERIDAAAAEALAAHNMAAEAGNAAKLAESLVTLGRAKLDLGQRKEARLRLGESLVMTRDPFADALRSIQALMFVSWLVRHDGRPDLAVRLLRAVEEERKRLGVVFLPMNAERAKQELELAMSQTEPTVSGEAPILDIEAARQEALDFLQPS